jgi:hypothetical protein
VDTRRFDALARALFFVGPRRRAIAVVLSGGLGLLGLAQPDDAAAARSGRCKPKCAPCEKCQRGDCKRKDGKRRCSRGKCKPRKDLIDCPAGTVRNLATCGCCQVAGKTCPFDGVNNCCSGLCPGGTCESKVSGDRCTFAAECGSGVCSGGVCACSALRQPCFQNGDCCDATTGLLGSVLCSDKDGFSGIVCCVSRTGRCVTSDDCCSSDRCDNGTCGP